MYQEFILEQLHQFTSTDRLIRVNIGSSTE